MRHSILAASVALAVASASFTAAAQSPDRTSEVATLRAQLAEMQARIDALEVRTDAQSDINIGTQENLDRMATTMPVVDTKGGLKVTSADKRFEFSAGGRIHFDAYAFDRDQAASTGTTEFRRARLTLQGKAHGWDYKLEQDFSAGSGLDGFRDVYIARSALGGKFTIGHFKPYRSMEELTSSNEVLMMERPFSTATGLFNGRQFQQGVGYMRAGGNYTAGLSVFNLRSASGSRNEGVGAAGRVTFAPINTADSTLHLGGWASQENLNQGSADFSATANYAGRRGPSQAIALTTGASRNQVTALGLEAAAAFGPLFFQGEYANASYGQPIGPDQDVATWYVQGSWMLNGGRKAYKPGNGVFASPRVTDRGLWELTARYDTIENKDIADMDVSSWIVGMNYYVNPNLRVMFNYTQGDNGYTGDETGQYALRTQFSF